MLLQRAAGFEFVFAVSVRHFAFCFVQQHEVEGGACVAVSSYCELHVIVAARARDKAHSRPLRGKHIPYFRFEYERIAVLSFCAGKPAAVELRTEFASVRSFAFVVNQLSVKDLLGHKRTVKQGGHAYGNSVTNSKAYFGRGESIADCGH